MPGKEANIDITASAPGGNAQIVVDNRGFARAVLIALLALLISAGGLTSALLLSSPELQQQRDAATRENPRPWKIAGADLISRMGTMEKTSSGGARITRLEPGEEQRGIFSRRAGFKAADYPFLEFNISGRNPASYYYFIWRTAENPDQVHNVALPLNGGSTPVRLLTQNPAWDGTIVEAGLDIYGELREDSPVVEHLTLLPSAATNLLRAIVTEWTALRSWSQLSAHTLRGTPWEPFLSPTLALACWAAIALAATGFFRLFFTFSLVHACAAVVLTAWVSLDLLWQRNLSWQLNETKYLFAGKTQHEKHLADRERELYKYAQHLKENALPEPGVKIYLLHDSEERGYRKLKAQYYLLPHNIFNYDKLPRASKLRAGDYLLVLDKIEELSYLPQKRQLRWGGHKLDVELIDHQEIGQLYRVRGLR